VSVTNEQGVTKTYDAQGNEITSQADASQTAPGASQTNTGSSTATPEGAKQAIKTRGDVNINNKIAIIKTNFGDVYVFFYPEIAPTHVRNFIYLAEKGFYKDVPFHRIVKGFMAQAGIPRADWLEPVSSMPLEARLGSNAMHFPGALSAARTNDPNSATSQFFLVFTREKAKHLDGKYTVFGQAFRGLDVLKKLENVKLGPNAEMGSGEVSKPLQDVHIVDVVIEDAGKYQEEINKIVTENSKVLEKERPQPSTPRPAGSG
jgi:peptidyl-prolyl cis-trans isomerase B (cyclophilin B)